MERPVMNPMFMDGIKPLAPRPSLLRRLWRLLMWMLKCLLVGDLCFWRWGKKLEVEDGWLITRFFRGLLYRMLFAPVLVVFVVCAFVYIGTHPQRVSMGRDPLTDGVYYDNVQITASDGARLDCWLIPLLDARNVLEQKENILRKRHAAIVLVHDHLGDRTQMLPLIQPFHKAGYIVMVVGTRGSSGLRGATFGLREAADVTAAVSYLRNRTGTDPNKISILGVGTGANAALLAASTDPKIAALILDHPTRNRDELIANYLSPPQPWLRWTRPLCRWTFEIAYKANMEDLDVQHWSPTTKSRPTLIFDYGNNLSATLHGNTLNGVKEFLARRAGMNSNLAAVSTDK